MRGPRLIHLWGPLSHCCKKKWKASINLWNAETDALQVRSAKILNHYWSAHDHCAFCCLRHKSIQMHGIVEILLGNRFINCYMRINRNRDNWNIWQNTWPTFFYKNHICFFLSAYKKTNTLHHYNMCGGLRLQSTTWGPRCNSLTMAIKISHTRAKYVK